MDGRPDLVVITIDAANLARNLFLLAQIMKTGVPLTSGLQNLITGPIAAGVGRALNAIGVPEAVRGLVVDGLISGVGQVLGFVPLMAITFPGMALAIACRSPG